MSGGRRSATAVVVRGPWYPLLVAAAFVLTGWSESAVSVVVVGRPLLIVLAAVAAMLLVARVALGGWDRAAAFVIVALFAVRTSSILHLATGVLLVALSIAAVLLARRISRRRVALADLTRTGNVLAAILLVVVIADAGLNGSIGRAVTDLNQAASTTLPAPGSTNEVQSDPNIYLVLLDGYPRADTLARLFEFDNHAFLAGLEDRGLEVSPGSRSNYMYTSLTFASMLHMKHLDDMEFTQPGGELRELINHNPVFGQLKSRGYAIVATAAPWEDVAIRNADFRCGDGPMTDFDVQLLRTTLLLPLIRIVAPGTFASRHRDLVNASLDCIVDAAEASIGTPRFGFFHVGSPHLPIVFDAAGDPAALRYYAHTAQELRMTDHEFAAAYVEQLKYLNTRVLAAIDSIEATDPEAVIVVMSDHGSESHFNWRDADRSDLYERFGNLFAARTPAHPGLFGDRPTPVNLFPRLLNAYFGLDLPEARDAQFVSNPGSRLDLEEIVLPDGGN